MADREDLRVSLSAHVRSFEEKLADVVRAFSVFGEALAMSNLDTAERWVAGKPRQHYADPWLTAAVDARESDEEVSAGAAGD